MVDWTGLQVTALLLLTAAGHGGFTESLIPATRLQLQPQIITEPANYRVPVTGVAELECSTLNLGDSLKVWKNGTRVISVGSLQIRNDPRISLGSQSGSLLIENVTVLDTGSYTCEIEADLEHHVTISHHLQVLEPARIVEVGGPDSLRVRAGTTVSLDCRAEGHPHPTVTWSKARDGRFVAVWAGPELTLERVTRREEGTYQCGADNGVGQTKYKRVELLISYPPEVSSSPPRVHASVGWAATISCLVWADPPATVSWYRGSQHRHLLDTQDTPAEMTEEGASVFRLTVLPEEQEQVTDYSCRAENSLGSSRATVLLSGLPAPPVISSGELSARQTRIAFATNTYNLVSYQLVWHTVSVPEVLAYNILVRKLPSGSIVYAWDSLELQENLMKERDKTGRIVFQSKQVENLQSDTAYVAKIKARNEFGWSDFSDEFLFYTRGEESRPVERQVLDSEDTTSSASALGTMSLLGLVLSMLRESPFNSTL